MYKLIKIREEKHRTLSKQNNRFVVGELISGAQNGFGIVPKAVQVRREEGTRGAEEYLPVLQETDEHQKQIAVRDQRPQPYQHLKQITERGEPSQGQGDTEGELQ